MVHYVVIIAAHCESNLRLLESGIRAIQCEYFTHWESIIFHKWWIAKYIFFYKPEPTVCWLWSVLDDLITFEYIEIMKMFWSMNMICRVWMNGVTICLVGSFENYYCIGTWMWF
jgi:hypothetical protein